MMMMLLVMMHAVLVVLVMMALYSLRRAQKVREGRTLSLHQRHSQIVSHVVYHC